jgi:hypothetical protein
VQLGFLFTFGRFAERGWRRSVDHEAPGDGLRVNVGQDGSREGNQISYQFVRIPNVVNGIGRIVILGKGLLDPLRGSLELLVLSTMSVVCWIVGWRLWMNGGLGPDVKSSVSRSLR